jgi:GGDEF domain-containing protein
MKTRKKTYKQLEFLAYHDRLTGLYNRNYLNDNIDSFTDCYVTIVDIDKLKETNDTQGHEMGDIRIKYVANVLKALDGTAIRLGGDEFLLMAKNNPDHLLTNNLPYSSFGTVHKCNRISLSEAMGFADKKMYVMKKKKVG